MSINNKKLINNSFEENSNQIGEKRDSTKKMWNNLTEEEILAKKKEAYECRVSVGGGADETIHDLIDYVKKGENCYCVLNGKKVYTIDLRKISQERGCDLENAFYLLYCGKTKIEQQKKSEEYNKQRELEKKRKELEAIEKIPGWIEEGKKYIDESKWSDWEELVEHAARGAHYGGEIELVLKILGMIDNSDSRQNIQKILDDEGGEGLYYNLVRDHVIYFSKKGTIASKNLHKSF